MKKHKKTEVSEVALSEQIEIVKRQIIDETRLHGLGKSPSFVTYIDLAEKLVKLEERAAKEAPPVLGGSDIDKEDF